MDLNFPGFSHGSPDRHPDEQARLELKTGSGAVFFSHNVVRQLPAVAAKQSVISSGDAHAKSENTPGLYRRKLADFRDGAKAVKTQGIDPAANDGIRTCNFAGTDPLQGINRADPDGAFRHLCVADDGEKLSHLLAEMDQGARENWLESPLNYGEDNDTPIIYATRHGRASVVSALVKHGANPTAENPHSELKHHALMIAAQNNLVTVIEKMAEWPGFDPNKPVGGATAIYLAVEQDAHEAVETLLKLRASTNCTVRYCVHNYSLLPFAIGMSGEEPVQQDGSILPTILSSPVFLAVSRGYVKTLELLLKYGASTRNPDPDIPWQYSPLAKALLGFRRSPEVVDLLLKHGADMYEKIPTDLCFNGVGMDDLRPSLLEHMSKESLFFAGRFYFKVLYDHFCETHDSQVSYGNFRNYFLFMYLVNFFYSFPEVAKEKDFSYVSHSLNKNIEIVESALSPISPGASRLSEENRLFLNAFCDGNRVMLKLVEKSPVLHSEFVETLGAWIIKVETMGVHHFFSIPEIKKLLEQEPDTSLSEWCVSKLETVAKSIQSFSRGICGK